MTTARLGPSSESQTITVSPWLGPGSLALLLLVFGCVVFWVTATLRDDIREQLISRDAHVLNLLLQNQIQRAEREEDSLFGFEGLGEVELWSILLESASAEGVFAVQLFDEKGIERFSSTAGIVQDLLPESVMERLKSGEAFSRYQEVQLLSGLIDIGFQEDREISTLEVYVPLVDSQTEERLGTARFLLDGSALTSEFAVLDGRLMRQGAVAVGFGGVSIVGLFWLAWRRLGAANREALKQAKRLLKANDELAMLARVSAVGSVTAHLIHGLKNPLAGLQQLVKAQSGGESGLDAEDWQGANEAAERMQRMVQEVVELLQDVKSGTSYEVSVAEFTQLLEERFASESERSGIWFSCEGIGNATLDSYRANIALLIVSNLARNAFEAVSASGRVSLGIEVDGAWLRVRVTDTGPGVAPELRESLFTPVPSGKSGGAGIGLAISMQLSKHLGGDLRYLDTVSEGAAFEFSMPISDSSEFDLGER